MPEELVPALLTPDELGVPADWVIRDIDAELAVADSLPDEVLDSFLGTLDCDGAPMSGAATAPWVSRRYSAPEVPLENGLLAIDITVVVEPEADAAERVEMLDDCAGPDLGVLTHEPGELTVADTTVASESLELLAPPSESVPYAAAFNATIANVDGSTVIVVLGGVDMGESWQGLADATATAALDHLGVGDTSESSLPSASTSPTPATSEPS